MPPKFKTVATVIKNTIDIHKNVSINDLERNDSNEYEFFEKADLLHNNKIKKINNSCLCSYFKSNRYYPYSSLEELYIERSEIISIRDLMLYGKSQTISRLLYYFWMDMDKKYSHLQSLHSQFLKEWLKGKIEMVNRDIPFIFENNHLESNILNMHPFLRDNCDINKLKHNMLGDNELIDRYGRFSAGSLIKINIEIAKMDNIINQRETLYTKIFAFFISVVYIIGKLFIPVFIEDNVNITKYNNMFSL